MERGRQRRSKSHEYWPESHIRPAYYDGNVVRLDLRPEIASVGGIGWTARHIFGPGT